MKKFLLVIATTVCGVVSVCAIGADSVRYFNQASDTARITSILQATRKANVQGDAERILFVARQLAHTPYESGTLEGEKELLTINMSKLDCTTFVESVIALAKTAATDTATYSDYEDNLLSIRYRGGVLDGYSSRLHYVSDWIADNESRGNLVEVTDEFTRAKKQSKTLNYMTTHRRSYKSLSNDEEYSRMQEVEKKYQNHTYSYIPKSALKISRIERELRDGDIVLITTSENGLDVTHMGIVLYRKGRPCLFHASSNVKKVVAEEIPLSEYLMLNNKMSGIRVVRMK